MNRDCEICRGNGIIRFPLYKRKSFVSPDMSNAMSVDACYRDYPCPECAGIASENRVFIIEQKVRIDERYIGAIRHHEMMNLAHHAIEQMIEKGLISFTEKRVPYDMTVEMTATIGVVSKTFVASIRDRAKGIQFEIANRVVKAAQQRIYYWGSSHIRNVRRLSKDTAANLISSALREVEADEARKASDTTNLDRS